MFALLGRRVAEKDTTWYQEEMKTLRKQLLAILLAGSIEAMYSVLSLPRWPGGVNEIHLLASDNTLKAILDYQRYCQPFKFPPCIVNVWIAERSASPCGD